jgi:hypothetical protein
MSFTLEQAKFVQELRDEGYTWVEVEKAFEETYGESRTHDNIRQHTKRVLLDLEPEEEIEAEIQDVRGTLPEYLLYKPAAKVPPGKAKTVGTALIIPDCHVPFADQRAYNLMLSVAQEIPDLSELVILGDYADFYAVSSHGKHPEYMHVLMDEVSQVRKELERLAKMFPNTKRVFLQGNHEYRLERYIYDKCPDLFGIVDTPTILELKTLGYEYVPYGPSQKSKEMGSKLFARQ